MAFDEVNLERGREFSHDNQGGCITNRNAHQQTLARASQPCNTLGVTIVTLTLTKGPQKGRSLKIRLGHSLVIGRAFSPQGTNIVRHDERRKLNDEDRHYVSDHLFTRAAPGRSGARAAFDAFERDEDFELADDAVSQTHSILFVDEAGVSVLDVMSTNGTYVNGERISDAVLASGDLLRIGETRMDVTIEDARSPY